MKLTLKKSKSFHRAWSKEFFRIHRFKSQTRTASHSSCWCPQRRGPSRRRAHVEQDAEGGGDGELHHRGKEVREPGARGEGLRLAGRLHDVQRAEEEDERDHHLLRAEGGGGGRRRGEGRRLDLHRRWIRKEIEHRRGQLEGQGRHWPKHIGAHWVNMFIHKYCFAFKNIFTCLLFCCLLKTVSHSFAHTAKVSAKFLNLHFICKKKRRLEKVTKILMNMIILNESAFVSWCVAGVTSIINNAPWMIRAALEWVRCGAGSQMLHDPWKKAVGLNYCILWISLCLWVGPTRLSGWFCFGKKLTQTDRQILLLMSQTPHTDEKFWRTKSDEKEIGELFHKHLYINQLISFFFWFYFNYN